MADLKWHNYVARKPPAAHALSSQSLTSRALWVICGPGVETYKNKRATKGKKGKS